MSRPGMADGRVFTSYIPNCELNNNIQRVNNISNNKDYRRYIQSNGEKLMNDFSTTKN